MEEDQTLSDSLAIAQPSDFAKQPLPALDVAAIAEDAAEQAFFAGHPSSLIPHPSSSPHARTEGWERRYQAVLDAFAGRPYVLGENDCFRLTCAMFEALTGIDRWPEFAGQYSTRRESLVLLHQYGSSFDAAFDWFFGAPHTLPGFARRGDIVKVLDANGEAHLGVSTGTQIAVMRPQGLSYESRRFAVHTWRIG